MNIREIRPGASGLPNRARINNIERYRLGRIVYGIEQAIKHDKKDYRTEYPTLAESLVQAKAAHDKYPLDLGGDNSTALGVQGRKAQTKAKDDAE